MERKTYTIFDNYDVCSKENMKDAKESILENVFNGEEKITLIDEYGKEVEVTQEEYAKVKLTDDSYMMNAIL